MRSITFIKSVHALLFIVMTVALAVFLYEVVLDRVTCLTWVTVSGFLAEGVVLIANRWKCPLTVCAERLGSPHGRVTDIFLPKWCADRAFQIYGCLWGGAMLLLAIRIAL
jgi:hypothetical protein